MCDRVDGIFTYVITNVDMLAVLIDSPRSKKTIANKSFDLISRRRIRDTFKLLKFSKTKKFIQC